MMYSSSISTPSNELDSFCISISSVDSPPLDTGELPVTLTDGRLPSRVDISPIDPRSLAVPPNDGVGHGSGVGLSPPGRVRAAALLLLASVGVDGEGYGVRMSAGWGLTSRALRNQSRLCTCESDSPGGNESVLSCRSVSLSSRCSPISGSAAGGGSGGVTCPLRGTATVLDLPADCRPPLVSRSSHMRPECLLSVATLVQWSSSNTEPVIDGSRSRPPSDLNCLRDSASCGPLVGVRDGCVDASGDRGPVRGTNLRRPPVGDEAAVSGSGGAPSSSLMDDRASWQLLNTSSFSILLMSSLRATSWVTTYMSKKGPYLRRNSHTLKVRKSGRSCSTSLMSCRMATRRLVAASPRKLSKNSPNTP
mmetsp:Transcript_33480/g.82929  ORF Transcript_33480/g.82929 Transcript_33480/m.82929 type:complete len:364 (-) Transcript_33480:2574-3665(-)